MNESQTTRDLGEIRRVVVKVGSAVIAGEGALRPRVVAGLADDVVELWRQGCQTVMVVSGSVAAGYQLLGLKSPPTAVLDRQVAASVGQPRLIAALAAEFVRHDVAVAQLLMSADDIEHRRRFLSARHTLHDLLGRGIVPIINENDALSDHDAIVGDNDHLAALVTNVVSAQLLVILSRVEGVFEHGGKGAVIPRVEVGSAVDQHVTDEISETGVGGMVAKVSAARIASHWGVPTIIAEGRRPGQLQRIVAGENVGTLFVPRQRRLNARKRWIAFRTRSRGAIRVDAGAKQALVEKGASLLPSGIMDVEGSFAMGARVNIVDENGNTFAVGLASYTADEIRRVQGRKQSEIGQELGYDYVREIIHRDDMVVHDDDQQARTQP